MTEQLFSVGMRHNKSNEKIDLQVWAANADEATYKVVRTIGGPYGEYSWTGSGPEYGDDNEVIRREAAVPEQSSKQEEKIEAYEARITELEKALEQEQEWNFYEEPNNVRHADYEQLENLPETRELTDEEAKQLLSDWYGFDKAKVIIHHTVPEYEINRHFEKRVSTLLERTPLWNDTGWAYIRFDCGCMSYELHYDELRRYLDGNPSTLPKRQVKSDVLICGDGEPLKLNVGDISLEDLDAATEEAKKEWGETL